MYKSNLRNFEEEGVLKSTIERIIYQKASNSYGLMCDAVVVAGPAIIRHILNARETVACNSSFRLEIVDINRSVYKKQIETIDAAYERGERPPTWASLEHVDGNVFEPNEVCGVGKNLWFYCTDIAKHKPTRFIDADLTASVKTCGKTLETTLRNQRSEFPLGTDIKGFIFTISLRGGGGIKNNLSWAMKKLLPITGGAGKITGRRKLTLGEDTRRSARGFNGVNGYAYISEIRHDAGALHDVSLYQYNDDGGPMLTGVFIYS